MASSSNKVFGKFRLDASPVSVAVATPSQTVAIAATQRVLGAGAHRHDGHGVAAVPMEARTAVQVGGREQLEIRREAGALAFFLLTEPSSGTRCSFLRGLDGS